MKSIFQNQKSKHTRMSSYKKPNNPILQKNKYAHETQSYATSVAKSNPHNLSTFKGQTCTFLTPQITENSLKRKTDPQLNAPRKKNVFPNSISNQTRVQNADTTFWSEKNTQGLVINQPNKMAPTDPPPNTIQHSILRHHNNKNPQIITQQTATHKKGKGNSPTFSFLNQNP